MRAHRGGAGDRHARAGVRVLAGKQSENSAETTFEALRRTGAKVMDWQTFWSALLGTTIPGLVVSLVLLWVNRQSTKAIESYKSDLASRLAALQVQLTTQSAQFTHWHQKRVSALVEIYDAFRVYLDFLRRLLYVPKTQGQSMDPYHDFRKTIDRNLIFLDDGLQESVNALQVELLQFWNWAMREPRGQGISDDAVQRRLDFEIPNVLDRLRREINAYADPHYRATRTEPGPVIEQPAKPKAP
jgi:hypothetical protein